MRKIRLPVKRNDITCRITESASSTKTPPTKNSKISCLMATATMPIDPPSASEPTSPMNTSAGCALYQRNPSDEPTRAPQKIVSSPTCGRCCKSRYAEKRAWLVTYVRTVSAPAATTTQPIASPSSPSVRFTAFDDPTMTETTNKRNGRYATTHRYGCLI